jgi:hypothetical protein
LDEVTHRAGGIHEYQGFNWLCRLFAIVIDANQIFEYFTILRCSQHLVLKRHTLIMKIFNNFNPLKLICFASIKQFISFLNKHLKVFIICYSLEIFEFVIKQRNIEILEVIIQKNHRE